MEEEGDGGTKTTGNGGTEPIERGECLDKCDGIISHELTELKLLQWSQAMHSPNDVLSPSLSRSHLAVSFDHNEKKMQFAQ